MATKSLKARNNDIANTSRQMEILSEGIFANGELPTFASKIKETNQFPLRPKKLEVLQINLGYMCNQVCEHCHVDAGPDRKEIMTLDTMHQCLEVIKKTEAHTLDLTGGAPEMNPNFRWFVEEASKAGIKDFIVRSNLTIIRANKKYYDLPEFFKKHNVHIVSSMPHWTRGKTDKQRGNGVFDKSIKALQELNAIGYGIEGSDLKLDLVYNPSGAFLPGDQMALENDFKKALKADFNIAFHSLFAITNLPISRFLDYLIASENYEDYMYNLVEAYNPSAVENVMCTNTLSVSWDGNLYDCDFNQMLNLKVASAIKHISDYNEKILQDRNIIVNQHCYGCTAGAGSSCQGVVA
ncbi:radical SAM/Cys-rich domain-containing protein [Polaribacter sp. Hel1_33_78]|jgi:radical SAM/Cys-rich protein|uniref:arsenosugar biosynthesis radical SAM (seleno)protein ArsS n=1 Tax=unclassified Polaribacter TaxID=196858 RepID=UPI00052DC5D7|nr:MULTISPECIES: arsenosugar biosynthesis radical SAM (seleno)protein ArsS [unclassified Polaribacter]KGL61581.1 radical SAM domain protein-containing protein [Polaribacter sp. Hel1_33_49]MBT3742691.1 radical SAM/Cys-rich domain protein [Polaribacter sp.]MBT7815407.1 radical SAM/Cys-rich domain protein [Polaribacter sp.]MDG1195681.1 arsenosugar biosynthesis radical SAM protein ArsS [Polaribacter sp.]MDG1402661.1 arsenosugar biosynthesis radical SAM protein ArsS [Polaribacter sp.]